MFRVAACVLVCSLASIGIARGDESEMKDKRLAFLLDRARALEFEVVGDETKVELRESPLLRYSNPNYEAHSKGALVVWTHDEIPVALASYSIRREKEVFREFVSLAETQMSCRMEGNPFWMPKDNHFPRQTLSGAPMPSPNPRLRLVQMKRMAERFDVTSKRLLPTPLMRYRSPERGVIDGAMFTFVTANDPEVMLLLEAVETKDESSEWRFTLARMSSQVLSAKLDNQPVWDVKNYWQNPQRPTDPYMERLDSELPEELAGAPQSTSDSQ